MQKGKSGGLFKNEIDELLGVSFNKYEEIKDILTKAQV